LPAEERADHIANELEAAKFGSIDACETDKSWAYIHSALNGTDPDGPLVVGSAQKSGFLSRLFGGRPSDDAGEAKFAIAGHDHVLRSEDYYIGLVDAARVETVAASLQAMPNDTLGQRVKAAHRRHQASGSADEAAEYAMGWYPGLVEFYRAAADAKKHVIFTVDY
jgi:hypothetical protein